MRWEDERYVRVYTRDTVDWQFLSFEAQALFVLLLRKVDRAGILKLGRHDSAKALAMAIGHPHRWEMVGKALEELVADGCIRIQDGVTLVPNFLEAQEAKASDKARQQKARELARDLAAAGMSHGVTAPSQIVTKEADFVTDGHTASHDVTPSRAVPSRAVPSEVLAPVASQPPLALEVQEPEGPSRFKQLRDAICAAYFEAKGAKYKWQGAKDTEALKRIMGVVSEDAEILARWRAGLAIAKGWLSIATVAQLDSKWNDLADVVPRRTGPACDVPGCELDGNDADTHGHRACREHMHEFTSWWREHRSPDPAEPGDFGTWLASIERKIRRVM